MLNIKSILTHIHNGVLSKDERYKILNSEHVLDKNTGVELHLYNEWFKVSHGDDIVASMPDFTSEEQEVVWKIKTLLVDPLEYAEMQKNFPAMLKSRRMSLSALYERPQPAFKLEPIEESGTTEYKG